MVSVVNKPTFTALEESEAFELLPPMTRHAVVTAREPFSPSVVLKMFTDNEWPLTAGGYDVTVADRLRNIDWQRHGDSMPALH